MLYLDVSFTIHIGKNSLRVNPDTGEVSRDDTSMNIDNCIILQLQIIRSRHFSKVLLEFIPKVRIGSSSESVVPAR